MKLLDSITTVAERVEWSETHNGYRIVLKDPIQYIDDRGHDYVGAPAIHIYPEFFDKEVEAGDIIKVESYYHIEGETQGDFMFAEKGVHEVIRVVYHPSQYVAPISPDEWSDFAHFIANESTHPISSYPEDGTFTRCPYSTMDRAIAAFRVYQDIIKAGTYDWSQLAAIRDIDCSDSGHYYDDFDNMLEQENPEPDYDYEPESFEYPEDGIAALEELKDELTAEEEAELEESDKFFEKLGLLD